MKQNSRREELLARGRQAFREKLAEQRRKIDDPLLGEVYVHPMTVAEKSKIFASYEQDKLRALATTIVARARDEDGSRLFLDSDVLQLLEQWNADDVERLATAINEDLGDEDAESINVVTEDDSGN